ncbi:hypothetical protein ARMSODRAFT_957028 [Armillaria solidipes]|uniref:Uncharacterized protein n=1 Tax=Armillaria solidipes TaxID=1076256 RepID=A0A2H3BKI1_9AGAR|nr:hypothetical protein ARMSODRAFT_957028 [Armillaria solidipes]
MEFLVNQVDEKGEIERLVSMRAVASITGNITTSALFGWEAHFESAAACRRLLKVFG